MEYILFIYNFLISILFAVTAAFFFVLHRQNNKPIYRWLMLLFVIFTCLEFLYYMADYMDHFRQYYARSLVTHPMLITVLYMAMHLCYAAIVLHYFGGSIKTADKIFFILFSFAVLIIPLLPSSSLHFIMMYFGMIQLMRYYWLIRGYKLLKAAAFSTKKYRQSRRFIYIAFIINTFALLENYFLIYHYDAVEAILPTVSHRNISADILTVYMAVVAFIVTRHLLAEHRPLDIMEDTGSHKLEEFARLHNFTQREKEIVSYMIAELNNQEIADLLYITQGTVKNHIHNIYQKTGTSKRSQLARLIKES